MHTLPVYTLRLVRERTLSYACPRVGTAEEAVRILSTMIGRADREHFVAIFLNGQLEPTGVHVVAIGNQSSIGGLTLRELFKAAIVAQAHGVVLGHNHPSGNPTPSTEDVAFTRAACEAGRLLSCQVIDHVIVTPSGAFASMLVRGELGGAS